jgi:methionyl-tRNA synthetase
MLRARAEGVEPQALIDEMYTSHTADFEAFGVNFDIFHSTHSDENRECARRIYTRLRDAGHIARRTIQQAYDEQAGMFLPDRFIKGTCPKCATLDQYGDSCESCGATYAPTELVDAVSVISGKTPVQRDSEHLFFQLGDFAPMLQEWIGGDRLQPAIRNKLAEWFEAGLRDWDISRDAPYWGFEIPDEPGKYFYVWLDAPIGYMASHLAWCKANGEDFDAVWAEDSDVELVHFIGKDIAYFHTLFWPATLHGAGYRKPTAVYCHGFLTVNGRKMSKSRGTFISASTWLEHVGPEYLRYYYAAKLSAGVDDIDLSLDDFVFRVNSDLVGKVVNIASRCAGILNKRYDSLLSESLDDLGMYGELAAARHAIGAHFEAREYASAIRAITALADRTNKYIDSAEPWKLVKDESTFERGRQVCTQGLNHYRVLITLLSPVVPQLAEASAKTLAAPISWDGLDAPLLGHTIEKFSPLMMRIDRKTLDVIVDASKAAAPQPPAPPKPKEAPIADEIGFDDFMKVDLRVARIVAADHVDGAKKLLRLTVDIGTEQRNIFAGIKAAYDPEALVGRMVVVVANLAPRKMRFGMSEGMVIAAGPGGQDIFLLSPDDGAVPGQRIK